MKKSNGFMDKRTFMYTALLGACLLMLGTMVWIQGETINGLQRQVAGLQSIQQGSMTTSVPQPNSHQPTTTPAAPAQVQAVSTRSAFGPMTSPDGNWVLSTDFDDQNQAGVVVRTHVLTLRSLKDGSEKTVLRTNEYMETGFQPVSGKPYVTDWLVAGWSQDGKKAYFIASNVTEGLGGVYPRFQLGYSALYEVDVASGISKLMLDRQGSEGGFTGMVDVYSRMNKVVRTQSDDKTVTVSLSALNGSGSKVVASFSVGKSYRRVSYAVLSPDATRLFVVTSEDSASYEQDYNFDYKLYIVELNNGNKLVTVPASAYQGNSPLHDFGHPVWTSNSEIVTASEGSAPSLRVSLP